MPVVGLLLREQGETPAFTIILGVEADMEWSEVRQTYPDQWLMIEALEAETEANSQRRLKRLAVIKRCAEGVVALQSYRRLHQPFPVRELYFVHTSREQLDIREQAWVGIRSGHAALPQG